MLCQKLQIWERVRAFVVSKIIHINAKSGLIHSLKSVNNFNKISKLWVSNSAFQFSINTEFLRVIYREVGQILFEPGLRRGHLIHGKAMDHFMLTTTRMSQTHCSPQQRSIRFIQSNFQDFPKKKFQRLLAKTSKITFSLVLDGKPYF